MASNCFTPIRGRRMRVTKVDTLGRPVPGICSQVVTSGFVTVEMTAEISEGETTEVRRADGSLCISERGCDSLNWYNISTEFCQVDPDLFAMINPTWTKLTNYQGDTIGWEESHSYSCDQGISIEIWSDVSGYVPTDPSAQGAWVYYLLPFVVGGTLGDLTIENGAVTFSLTGRTKKGSQWGRGPYNVMANPPDGTCGPLITPFSPEAPRRVFLTTCRPPDAACGCQPLSAPNGPAAVVTEDTTDVTRMTVNAYVTGTGPFTVDWGDGNVEDLPSGITGKTHHYGAAGTYVVAVYTTADKARATYTTITVPFTGVTPEKPLIAAISEDTTDVTRATAKAEWNNEGFATVRIEWGDGTITTAQPATGTAVHQYTSTGQFTVRVVDESDSSRVAHQLITVPFGPTMTVTRDRSDVTDRRSVIVTVDNYGAGNVSVNWGDGTPNATNTGDGSSQSKHKYATGGQKTITVVDSDDPSRTASFQVTLPYPPDPALTLTVTESIPPGPDRRTVTATWDNQGLGAVTIAWGDNTTETGPDAWSLDHTYATAGTFQVTVTDQAEASRSITVPVTVPFHAAQTLTVAESDPMDPTRRKVNAVWDNQGAGTVTVSWGDGTPDQTGQADAGNLDHVYGTAGQKTVTVTDTNDASRTISQNVTLPFATTYKPSITVAKGTGANDVIVRVVNAETGSTYEITWDTTTVAWEDIPAGTPPTTADHTYTVGEHSVQVRDKATPAKISDVMTFTVPIPTLLSAQDETAPEDAAPDADDAAATETRQEQEEKPDAAEATDKAPDETATETATEAPSKKRKR